MNLNKCQCSSEGFCPLYNKKMDEAGHNWCKTTTKEKRQNYKNKSSNINLQNKKLDIIHSDLSKTSIACLGHCEDQFSSIEDQDYLTKIYLDELDLGIYNRFQTNQYSETRAYLSNIFDYSQYDYVGCVTASWNMKYINKRNRIDRAGRWLDPNKLDDKNTIYCATVSTTESWIEGENSVMNWLGTPKKHIKEVLKFHENLSMKPDDKQVANHNQIIAHKDLFLKISNHFRENIFEYSKIFNKFNLSDFSDFARKRLFGFYCEFSTMMFLSNNDIRCEPVQVCNNSSWFNESKIKERDEGKYHDNRQ